MMCTSIKKILALLLFVSGMAFCDLPNADKQYLEIKNLLKNPGAEQALSGWDKFGPGGSSLSTTVTTNFVGSGASAIAYDASANNQFLGSSLAVIPAGLFGKNCLGKINFKGADSNLTFQVVDQNGASLGSSLLIAKTNYAEATTAFTCPTSGSLGIRVAASANAAAVFVDDAYVGLDWRQQNTTPLVPTIQKFTAVASGTYTTPANARWLKVKMVGAGGGGGGSGTAGSPVGGAGAVTTFGTSLLTANAGSGVTGGTATISLPAYGTVLTGGNGGGTYNSDADASPLAGRDGASTPFGSGGPGGGQSAVGVVGGTNTGVGGGGAGTSETVSVAAGAGGGAGGYIEAIIPNPSTSYSFAIGGGGTGGAAGPSGFVGGAGAAGYIIVEEYYN